MLENHKSGSVAGTNHEWVETSVGNTASVLAANVNEDGVVLVRPVLVVHPVPLSVSGLVLEIKVVVLVVEPLLLELSWVNPWKLVPVRASSSGKASHSGSRKTDLVHCRIDIRLS